MNIFSWNVAGLRARLKPDENIHNNDYNIINNISLIL